MKWFSPGFRRNFCEPVLGWSQPTGSFIFRTDGLKLWTLRLWEGTLVTTYIDDHVTLSSPSTDLYLSLDWNDTIDLGVLSGHCFTRWRIKHLYSFDSDVLHFLNRVVWVVTTPCLTWGSFKGKLGIITSSYQDYRRPQVLPKIPFVIVDIILKISFTLILRLNPTVLRWGEGGTDERTGSSLFGKEKEMSYFSGDTEVYLLPDSKSITSKTYSSHYGHCPVPGSCRQLSRVVRPPHDTPFLQLPWFNDPTTLSSREEEGRGTRTGYRSRSQ